MPPPEDGLFQNLKPVFQTGKIRWPFLKIALPPALRNFFSVSSPSMPRIFATALNALLSFTVLANIILAELASFLAKLFLQVK